MIIKKITVGYVVQTYNTKLNKYLSQEFVASNDVTLENEQGESVNNIFDDAEMPDMPLTMIQPD